MRDKSGGKKGSMGQATAFAPAEGSNPPQLTSGVLSKIAQDVTMILLKILAKSVSQDELARLCECASRIPEMADEIIRRRMGLEPTFWKELQALLGKVVPDKGFIRYRLAVEWGSEETGHHDLTTGGLDIEECVVSMFSHLKDFAEQGTCEDGSGLDEPSSDEGGASAEVEVADDEMEEEALVEGRPASLERGTSGG